MFSFKKTSMLNLISGIIVTLVGFYICIHPLDMIVLLSLYLGIILIVAGSVYLFEYYKLKQWRYLGYGMLNLVLGILMVTKSGFVATMFVILLGLWILFSSIIQIATAIQFKRMAMPFWIYLFIAGSIGVLFSFLVLYRPFTSMLTITIIVGSYMMIYGIMEIFEYFILDNKKDKIN